MIAQTVLHPRRIAVAMASVVLVVGIAGCGPDAESDSPSDPADAAFAEQEAQFEAYVLAEGDWDAQQGDAWEEFSDAYTSAWEAGCDIAFESSPDGSLYDQGIEYTVYDCYDLAPPDASSADAPSDIPDSPYDEGLALGETDGCVAAFDELTSYGVLNWGDDSYDASVCP